MGGWQKHFGHGQAMLVWRPSRFKNYFYDYFYNIVHNKDKDP